MLFSISEFPLVQIETLRTEGMQEATPYLHERKEHS